MGGKGSGGARVGSGPPRQVGSVRWRREQRRARLMAVGAATESQETRKAPAAASEPPADMPANQAAVWRELAPHAAAAGTLTPATAWAFAELCDVIVLKRATLSAISRQGLMVEGAAHPLLSRYTALQGRVESGLTRFKLLPLGKAMAVDEALKDEFAQFDAPLVVLQGGKS